MAKTATVRRLLLACPIAVLLAACGSSNRAASSAPAPSGNPPATTSAPGPAATATTGPATTTTSAGLCRAPGLHLSFLGQQGATGHGELGFSLRNTTSTACHTFGYPGILFLDSTGAPLPTSSIRSTQDFFGTVPERPLQLGPGESLSFRVGVTHSGAGGSNAGCTTAAALQVIPPDDTESLRVSIPQGAYECRAATVSPVRPGSSAYP
jgi:hypothetical protein